MSEFSPDTIQFQKAASTPSPVLNNARLSQLEQWLAQSSSETHKNWLEQHIHLEKLNSYRSFLTPTSLPELQDKLRTLREHISPQDEPLSALIHYWLKQAEALSLRNVSAYEKVLAERPVVQNQLSAGGYVFSFIAQAQAIDDFLTRLAQEFFPRHVSTSTPLDVPRHAYPQNSTEIPLLENPRLPNGLPLSIYQRSSKSWLRRAMRYLQLAQQSQFKQTHLLQKCVKSLYACLTLDPHNTQAILLLGWLEACAGYPAQAMKYLEQLRQEPHEPEMIFLIRFLQNRPLL